MERRRKARSVPAPRGPSQKEMTDREKKKPRSEVRRPAQVCPRSLARGVQDANTCAASARRKDSSGSPRGRCLTSLLVFWGSAASPAMRGGRFHSFSPTLRPPACSDSRTAAGQRHGLGGSRKERSSPALSLAVTRSHHHREDSTPTLEQAKVLGTSTCPASLGTGSVFWPSPGPLRP